MSDADSVMARLSLLIEQRHRDRPSGSYTTELFAGGHPAISSKVIEEAYELVQAAGEADDFASRGAVAHEAADLVYHLLVLLTANGIGWTDVERELSERFGVSGLTEKARRQSTPEAPSSLSE